MLHHNFVQQEFFVTAKWQICSNYGYVLYCGNNIYFSLRVSALFKVAGSVGVLATAFLNTPYRLHKQKTAGCTGGFLFY